VIDPRVAVTAIGLLWSTGCSTESARLPAATPRPDTARAIAPTPAPQFQPDTARLAPVEIVTQGALDTTRCAVSDTTPKKAAMQPIDSEEVVAFRTASGKASRVCGELRIQLLNGRTAVFRDDTTAGPKFGLLRYAGYQKTIHSHVIHRYPYEGTGAFLVVDDSTGESRIVFGMPVASPDGPRFVLTSMEDEMRIDPGLIEIWHVVGRKPEKEFFYSTEDSPWQPSHPVWVDSVTIDFIENSHSSPGEPYVETPGRVVKSGTTWALVPAPAIKENPVGVWRGTSRCMQRPSSCNDEIVVYRITRINTSDSLSIDAFKIVNGQEDEMGVIGCRVSGTQLRCPMPNGTWHFTVSRDSLVGDLKLPDNTKFRDVRTVRSR
jgi:hypothetical protein